MTVGIICEYNPLHLGHQKQLEAVRAAFGADTAIVCAMSGSFVQRGMPAIFDKSLRAEAAIRCGADLVVELPVTAALSSAEGFASGGVAVLSQLCGVLCFGAETGSANALMSTARALLREDFPERLRQALKSGCSFPAARAAALEAMGLDASLLRQPNDTLAVEYCKAILSQGSPMEIFPIPRPGSYHDTAPDPENPSATAVRQQMISGSSWTPYVPAGVRSLYADAAMHTLAAGERAILAKLRTMADADFEALPDGGEGLWRKLMHASREAATLEDILTAAKSKRYTRTRLDRMVMCAFLGITGELRTQPLPYARILAFNDRGRRVLQTARGSGFFRNAGEFNGHPYEALERRCGDLYGLFCTDAPEAPGAEARRRVRFLQG